MENESIQEEPAKMGRKITAIVKLLRTQKEEDIIRILNQQSEPTIFLTQLQSESEIRLVHTITQVTAPLGDQSLRLDGKLVAFFKNYQASTTPTVMKELDNIFKWAKVFLQNPEQLTTERSWTLGDTALLWDQDDTKPEFDVCKIVPLPVVWTNLFMNKDLTPGEGFLLIKGKIEKWIDEEAATVQPVLNWLLAAGCKAKVTHRSRTETPNTLV